MKHQGWSSPSGFLHKELKKVTVKEANYNFYTFRSKTDPCKTHACVFKSACALFTCVHLSPAVIMRPNSIKACILLDWVTAFLQDEVGIPVQTLFPFYRHAHHTTIKFPILLVTVVWPSRETKNKETFSRARCVLGGQWSSRDMKDLPTSQKVPLYPSGQEHWKLERLGPFMQAPPFWQGLGMQGEAVRPKKC